MLDLIEQVKQEKVITRKRAASPALAQSVAQHRLVLKALREEVKAKKEAARENNKVVMKHLKDEWLIAEKKAEARAKSDGLFWGTAKRCAQRPCRCRGKAKDEAKGGSAL